MLPAALSPPPLPLHSRDPAGPQAAAYLQGISLIALLRKTHLRKGAGSRFETGILQPEPIISHITSLSLGAIRWAFSANVSVNLDVCFFGGFFSPPPILSSTCLGGQPLECCIVSSCRYIPTKHLTLCWLRSQIRHTLLGFLNPSDGGNKVVAARQRILHRKSSCRGGGGEVSR